MSPNKREQLLFRRWRNFLFSVTCFGFWTLIFLMFACFWFHDIQVSRTLLKPAPTPREFTTLSSIEVAIARKKAESEWVIFHVSEVNPLGQKHPGDRLPPGISDVLLVSKPVKDASNINRIESLINKTAKKEGDVVVVCGFLPSHELTLNSPAEVYIVALCSNNNRSFSIGFICSQAEQQNDLRSIAVTVDAIEARTSMDFFSAMEDQVEDCVESTFDFSLWGE